MMAEFASGFDDTDPNYPTILSNYLNHRWGYTLSFETYKSFEDKFAIDPDAILCNISPYTPVAFDIFTCMYNQIATAVMNGRIAYQKYILEERRKFKLAYVNKCSAAKGNVHLEAKQQIYHYTLYYFDQAGNLMRTVPPEGVHPVDDEDELLQIAKARDFNAGADCHYNEPPVEANLSEVLDEFTNALNNNIEGIEFWLKSDHSASQQVITLTGDNEFLFN